MPKTPTSARVVRSAIVAAALLALAAPFVASCDPIRFAAACQTNQDCGKRDDAGLGKVCFNQRCLECHYDSDCGGGRLCSTVGTCDSLDQRPKGSGEPGEATAADAAPPSTAN